MTAVLLNWGKNRTCTGQHSHWGEEGKCTICGGRTCCRDCTGRTVHKVCAEAELSS